MRTLVILFSIGLFSCATLGDNARRVNDGARTVIGGVCAIPPGLIFDGVDWIIDTGEDLVSNTADAAQ